jgi:hypothetical protein
LDVRPCLKKHSNKIYGMLILRFNTTNEENDYISFSMHNINMANATVSNWSKKHVEKFEKKKLAERGFDPRTFGL